MKDVDFARSSGKAKEKKRKRKKRKRGKSEESEARVGVRRDRSVGRTIDRSVRGDGVHVEEKLDEEATRGVGRGRWMEMDSAKLS